MHNFESFLKLLIVVLIITFLGAGVSAETDNAGSPSGPFFTADQYKPEIPGPSDHLGFALGSKPVNYSQLTGYIKELANSSNRIQLFKYGQSYEGHDLYYLAITSEENMTKIEEVYK